MQLVQNVFEYLLCARYYVWRLENTAGREKKKKKNLVSPLNLDFNQVLLFFLRVQHFQTRFKCAIINLLLKPTYLPDSSRDYVCDVHSSISGIQDGAGLTAPTQQVKVSQGRSV